MIACLERSVVGDIRVSGRVDWEIGSMGPEMPQRIEISLEFSWRLGTKGGYHPARTMFV